MAVPVEELSSGRAQSHKAGVGTTREMGWAYCTMLNKMIEDAMVQVFLAVGRNR